MYKIHPHCSPKHYVPLSSLLSQMRTLKGQRGQATRPRATWLAVGKPGSEPRWCGSQATLHHYTLGAHTRKHTHAHILSNAWPTLSVETPPSCPNRFLILSSCYLLSLSCLISPSSHPPSIPPPSVVPSTPPVPSFPAVPIPPI